MSLEKSPSRAKRSIAHEEEKAWISFYKRVGNDLGLATEVLAQLDNDVELKRVHLALYLCCKESLRTHKARKARNQRIGLFVRWLGNALLMRSLLAVLRSLRNISDIIIACLPGANLGTVKEPAMAKARQLTQEPRFAAAQTDFREQQASTQTPSPMPGALTAPDQQASSSTVRKAA